MKYIKKFESILDQYNKKSDPSEKVRIPLSELDNMLKYLDDNSRFIGTVDFDYYKSLNTPVINNKIFLSNHDLNRFEYLIKPIVEEGENIEDYLMDIIDNKISLKVDS
jgi:hypothetical protein